uniref:RRM domain-containing protein n=1 Tax=Mesocestoides corti TaxID=53468 RepID=A0A5K3F0S7_MESCO
MSQEAFISETFDRLSLSSSNVSDEIAKKLQRMRQQISSSSRRQILMQKIDSAVEDLRSSADNALLKANDRVRIIEKEEAVDLDKVACRIAQYSEAIKELKEGAEYMRRCKKLTCLLQCRQKMMALVEGAQEIESFIAGFASSLRLLSVSNVLKHLSALLESTRLLYATSILTESDDVDEDWRRDALRSVSVEKSEDAAPCSKEAAGNQTAESAGSSKETSAAAKEKHGVDVSPHRDSIEWEYRVFFKGMKANITEPDLREAFSVFGHVGEIRRFLQPNRMHTNGRGYVTFDSLSAVRSAFAASPLWIGTSLLTILRLDQKPRPSGDKAVCSGDAACAQVTELAGCSREASATARSVESGSIESMDSLLSMYLDHLEPPAPPFGSRVPYCTSRRLYFVYFTGVGQDVSLLDFFDRFIVFGRIVHIIWIYKSGYSLTGNGYVAFDLPGSASAALAAGAVKIRSSTITLTEQSPTHLPDPSSCFSITFNGLRKYTSEAQLLEHFNLYGPVANIDENGCGMLWVSYSDITSAIVAALVKEHDIEGSILRPIQFM